MNTIALEQDWSCILPTFFHTYIYIHVYIYVYMNVLKTFIILKVALIIASAWMRYCTEENAVVEYIIEGKIEKIFASSLCKKT